MENEFKYDQNSNKIIIPYGTTKIPDHAFENFTELESISIPDTVTEIGEKAFKGCSKLQQINLPSSLRFLGDLAFNECTSLEEITIPSSLPYISYGLFSHCHNLKRVNLHNNINYIDDYAFFHCTNLENFTIPTNCKSIGRMALTGCEKIKSIHIPKNVEFIETGALALMSSLTTITVAKENTAFFTEDEDTVLLDKDSTIIQYAINCNREEFIVGYYQKSYGTTEVDNQITPFMSNELIYNIADYAFAGAKKLKKIYFPSEIESIGPNTFQDCDNLSTLIVFKSNYGDAFLLHITGFQNDNCKIPFREIIFEDGINVLCDNLASLFENAHTVRLPQDLESISSNVFSKSSHLKSLLIPRKTKSISPNTFHPNTLLTFPELGPIEAAKFNRLQTKTNAEYYTRENDRDNIRILSLTDGTYYVKIDQHDTVKITKEEINNLSRSSGILSEKPEDLINYLLNLFTINYEQIGELFPICQDPNLALAFQKFASDAKWIDDIANKKVAQAIREVINASGIHDEFLFSSLLMNNLTKSEIKKVIDNYNESISRFFRFASLLNPKPITNIDKIIDYCNLLEKYGVYDKFLYNTIFADKLSFEEQERLIKNFNKNIKRLLINSKAITNAYGDNLKDLIKLCTALGIFDENKILSQKMTTFITEVMFNQASEFPIVGDAIHSIFSEINPRSETDYEFISFFIENYYELINIEKTNSGQIARIYNNFRDISLTSTSHRGSQRHLKVTLKKCLDYFITSKFANITEKNKRIAFFLQRFYSESFSVELAEKIIQNSENAPRNIFSKVTYDSQGNPIYSHDSSEDLREHLENDFSYEWLPKQDLENLVLGKYCSCCAHLLGAGAGIMNASMTLDNVQNLIIRNPKGDIVAKMTLYINKEKGYAVFNTAEVNIHYQQEYFLKLIYKAFQRGVNAFVQRYNENNLIPLKIITIGTYRNLIKDNLGNIETELLPTPNYSDYGYSANNQSYGTYNGDSKAKQILVYKRN